MAGPGKGGAPLCGGHRGSVVQIRGQGSGVPLSEPRAPVRYQRSGCRHIEYHRPRFFSFHCGSAHSRFSCSAEIVEPVVAGLSSEQPPTMARTASINNLALNRPRLSCAHPVDRASPQPAQSSDANAASTVKQNHHRSTYPGRRLDNRLGLPIGRELTHQPLGHATRTGADGGAPFPPSWPGSGDGRCGYANCRGRGIRTRAPAQKRPHN